MSITKEVKPKVEEPVVEEITSFDPWRPVLKSSPSLQTTEEQEVYIRKILEICCSDSAFAKKAYLALQYILTGTAPVAPVLSSLAPNTTVVLVPVTVVVTGTGFDVDSVVKSAGNAVVTTFVSDTELSFSPDVTLEGTQAITVENADLQVSAPVDFTVTAVLALRAPVEEEKKTPSTVEHKGQEKK
jgi:hypothetical protein